MKINVITVLLFALLFCSCNSSRPEVKKEIAFNEEISLEDNIGDNDLSRFSYSKIDITTKEKNNYYSKDKIIQKGNILIETINIKKTKETINLLLQSYKGYYEKEEVSGGTNYSNYNLKIRIPSKHFDTFIKNLESGENKITQKSIESEDISVKYYDVESRLKSKRKYLEHYQNMVKSAKSVKDMLEIQEQIRQLQEDIESSESVMRNLTSQISYSTLTVNLHYSNDDRSSAYTISFFSKIKNSLSSGSNLAENFFLKLISFWPIFITIGLLILAWKSYKRKKSNTKYSN